MGGGRVALSCFTLRKLENSTSLMGDGPLGSYADLPTIEMPKLLEEKRSFILRGVNVTSLLFILPEVTKLL